MLTDVMYTSSVLHSLGQDAHPNADSDRGLGPEPWASPGRRSAVPRRTAAPAPLAPHLPGGRGGGACRALLQTRVRVRRGHRSPPIAARRSWSTSSGVLPP